MAETNAGTGKGQAKGIFEENVEHLDSSLDILERHSAEVDKVEDDIQEEMKRRDREYKDARLHSVPKARKHVR